MTYDYDLLVIGAGSGGLAASKNAAKLGKKVAIIEHDLVGGTCVIRGCVPKKIMSYAGAYADTFSEAIGYGFKKNNAHIDFKTLADKRNTEIERLNRLHIKLLNDAGVDIIIGHAKFTNNYTLEVDGISYSAETILIATGGRPSKLPIQGAEHTLISDDLWHLKKLPNSMLIMGGGYIALEFASIFNALGTSVSVVIRRDLILRGFDSDIRQSLQHEMMKRGIKFYTNDTPEKFIKTDKGVQTTLKSGEIVETEYALMATGRKPNSDTIGIENTNVTLDTDGSILVNDKLQTAQENIYAIGDVVDRVNLTPVAIKHGRMVTNNLYTNTDTTVDDASPTAVFTSPPVGTVGLTEEAAKKEFGADSINIYTSTFRPMVHVLSERDEKTFMKMIVHKDSDKVLGLHMMGRDAAEIIQGFAVAVRAGLTKADFDATVAIHPSSAEEFVLMR